MASNAEDVFSLKYMRNVRFYLKTVSGWPKTFDSSNVKSLLSWTYRCMLIIVMFLHMCSTTIYSKNHIGTDLGQTYLNVMLSSVFFHRLFLPFQEKFYSVVQKFILEFHLVHHKHKTDISAKVYRRVDKICTTFSKVSQFELLMAVLVYNGIPLYITFNDGMFSKPKPENGTFTHAIDLEVLLDQYTSDRDYIIIFIYNFYISYNVANGIIMNDLLVFIIVFHIWGHLHVLIHDIKYFSRASPQSGKKSPVRNIQEDMMNRLKDIIKHHQVIKEFMAKTSEAFSISLCGYIIFTQLSGCVLLLKSFSMNATDLARYGPLTVFVFQQLIETSVIFELICSKGNILVDKVYELPWERMDARNRRTVVMLLRSVQGSLALKAGGMVPVGVMTMSAIIRTSCSYFLMLKTFTQS